MIWEQQSKVILMLTDLEESGVVSLEFNRGQQPPAVACKFNPNSQIACVRDFLHISSGQVEKEKVLCGVLLISLSLCRLICINKEGSTVIKA
jgi:hypothetical protein